MKKIPLIAIVGPTSSGKTDLSIQLAKKFNGEIISADSRQVYKGMDIGTGKVTQEEMQGIPHHLLDVADPKDVYTLADYKKDADKAIQDIYKRGKLPFLVGGTGLYVKAVIDNYQIPQETINTKRRNELNKLTLKELQSHLKKIDLEKYNSIDIQNPRRLIRAIEIAESGNQKKTQAQESPYDTLILGIDLPRETLYKKIDQRVDERIQQGMIKEVQSLIKQGVSYERLHDLGQEYRFCAEYLKGEWASKEEMIQKLKFAIHGFARRQLTWWRKEKRIHWIQNYDEAEKLIETKITLTHR